jgi:hypothetical protein
MPDPKQPSDAGKSQGQRDRKYRGDWTHAPAGYTGVKVSAQADSFANGAASDCRPRAK